MPKKPQPKKKAPPSPKKKTSSREKKWRPFDYGPGALQPLNDMGWPWRSVQFEESPKALGIQKGWLAKAEFSFPFIPRTPLGSFTNPWGHGTTTVMLDGKLDHQWEPIGISMSQKAWELWGNLNQKDRMEILHALAHWPVKNNFFEGGNKSRGHHNLIEKICIHNSQWAGSLFLYWAKATPASDALKVRVVNQMKRDGFFKYSPHYLAAYLTKLSWEIGSPHMGTPIQWPLKNDPTLDPQEFFKTLFKNSPYHPNDHEKSLEEIGNMVLNLFTKKGPTLHYPPGTFVASPCGFPHPFIPTKPHRL